MPPRLRAFWRGLLGSLWFVPGLLVLAAMALAVAMVELSARVDDDALEHWPRMFGAGAEASRSLLSAVAGGMITVAGITFSLTMVAVTQASSQYSPRILRNFMRDRANQLALGTFVGIFAYCLVVLRTIREVNEAEFVPGIAVLVGIVLALVGVGVLIFFVHHIATTLQATSIMARIAHDTVHSIDELFPEPLGDEADEEADAAAHAAEQVTAWRAVHAPRTGYVQLVDINELLEAARDSGRLIRMERGVGEFVPQGVPLASIAAEEGPGGLRESAAAAHRVPASRPRTDDAERKLRECVAGAFELGETRTVEQDSAFGIRQLVDMATRALSPGINDITTAVGAVEYLGSVLVRMAERRIETRARTEGGRVRVLARGPTYEGLLRLAHDEIRQSAHGNVAVLARMLEMLAVAAAATPSPRRRALLAEQAALVREVAVRTVPAPHDLARLESLATAAREACAGPPEAHHTARSSAA